VSGRIAGSRRRDFRARNVLARARGGTGSPRGLSLLEVILALAILGLAMATIGELMRIGSRNAESARDLTTAQILCETKMAELVTGLTPPVATSLAPMADVASGEEWLYSVETQPLGQDGLLAVRVEVQQNPEVFTRPARFSLIRWMIDPNMTATLGTDASSTTSSTNANASGS
jgi:type II secretion system protein I